MGQTEGKLSDTSMQGNQTRMSNSQPTPFSFLEGEDDVAVKLVHFTVSTFEANPERANSIIESCLTDDNKKRFTTFKEQVEFDIPMILALLPKQWHQDIVGWINSHYDKKEGLEPKTLPEVLKFAKNMLEHFESEKMPAKEAIAYQHPVVKKNPSPLSPHVTVLEARDGNINRKSSGLPAFEHVTKKDCISVADPALSLSNDDTMYDAQTDVDVVKGNSSIIIPPQCRNEHELGPMSEAKQQSSLLTNDTSGGEQQAQQSGKHQQDEASCYRTHKAAEKEQNGEEVHKQMQPGFRVPTGSITGSVLLPLSVPTPKEPLKPNDKCLNLILVGETGVGKTTFVNGFPNYMKHLSFDEALKNDPTVVVRTSFYMSLEKDASPIDVVVEPPYKPEEYINEQLVVKGQSRTQNARIHNFCFKYHGGNLAIRLIDTPGANDTRGQEHDQTNLYNTVKVIEELGEIHGVCVLLKPNESRATTDYRRTLDTVLSKLPKSAMNSVIFCFTHTEPFEFCPGESLSILEEYLKDLKSRTHVDIKLTQENIFCIDNNSFRFHCAINRFKPEEISAKKAFFERSWMNNKRQMERMIEHIKKLNPHLTSDTAGIMRVDNCFQNLLKAITPITHEHAIRVAALESKVFMGTLVSTVSFAEKEKEELDNRVKSFNYILTVCACFAYFLQHQSVGIPDYYWINLQGLIKEQEEACYYTYSVENQTTFGKLKSIIQDYKRKLAELERKAISNECGSASPLEIASILGKMKKLKMYGEKIPQVIIFPKNGHSFRQVQERF